MIFPETHVAVVQVTERRRETPSPLEVRRHPLSRTLIPYVMSDLADLIGTKLDDAGRRNIEVTLAASILRFAETTGIPLDSRILQAVADYDRVRLMPNLEHLPDWATWK